MPEGVSALGFFDAPFVAAGLDLGAIRERSGRNAERERRAGGDCAGGRKGMRVGVRRRRLRSIRFPVTWLPDSRPAAVAERAGFAPGTPCKQGRQTCAWI